MSEYKNVYDPVDERQVKVAQILVDLARDNAGVQQEHHAQELILDLHTALCNVSGRSLGHGGTIEITDILKYVAAFIKEGLEIEIRPSDSYTLKVAKAVGLAERYASNMCTWADSTIRCTWADSTIS